MSIIAQHFDLILSAIITATHKSAYPKIGTQDPRPGIHLKGETRDPRTGTLILHGTRDPKPRTLKETPGTPMIGETGDPKLTSFVEPWTEEL